MFSGENQVFWMDITNGKGAELTTITELFIHCAHRGEYVNNSLNVDLSSENIKIRDFFGWTQLLSISKYTELNIIVSELHVKSDIAGNDDSVLYVDRNYLIPVFSEESIKSPEKGFHGELLYKYSMKAAGEVDKEDLLRVYGRYEDFVYLDSKYLSTGTTDFYKLKTKSGWFNCSDVHICDCTNNKKDQKVLLK